MTDALTSAEGRGKNMKPIITVAMALAFTDTNQAALSQWELRMIHGSQRAWSAIVKPVPINLISCLHIRTLNVFSHLPNNNLQLYGM